MLGMLMPQVSGLLGTSVLEANDFEGKDLENAIVYFHTQMNDKTNEFLEKLTSEDTPTVDYVLEDGECGTNNVSTYCLAVKLDAILTDYETYLLAIADEIDFEEEDEGESVDISLEDALIASQNKQSIIDTELEAARYTLDLTLSVYNQIQLVYPVHQEFIHVIGGLADYNSNLADVRSQIEHFPSEFNDVTTVQCK